MINLPLFGLLATLLASQVSAEGITLQQLQQIMKGSKPDAPEKHLVHINRAMKKYNINTPLRQAHFLAQIGYETSNLRTLTEKFNVGVKRLRRNFRTHFPNDDIAQEYAHQPKNIANRVYANRNGNGDEASGDGYKYKGRGLLHLAGKKYYQRYNKVVVNNIVKHSYLIARTLCLAADSAGWYWKIRKANSKADRDNIKAVTKALTGRAKGFRARRKYLQRAKAAFGI